MNIHPSDIVLNIINIVVLFVLLRLILWKPINRFLAARSEAIAEKLENAEAKRLEAEKLEAEYREKLDGLEEESRKLLRDTHVKAQEESKEILAEAKKQAEAVLDEARVKIESEKAIAVARARDEVAQLATDMAARILKREVSAEDTKTVAEDFFRESR